MRDEIQKLKDRIAECEGEIKSLGERLVGLPEPLTIRWRDVDCGRSCSTDPNHGPYAYGYKREPFRIIEYYIGKNPAIANAHQEAMQITKELKALVRKRDKLLQVLNLWLKLRGLPTVS